MAGAARVALVTGGSRGIGFAVAQELHRSGWKVALTSRALSRAQEAAERISPEVLPLAYHAPSRTSTDGKTSEPSDPARIVAQVATELGDISALVNAAGISKDALLLRLADAELDELLLTNLVGPIQLTRAVARGMLQRRRGGSDRGCMGDMDGRLRR